jgi:hypothetical protein
MEGRRVRVNLDDPDNDPRVRFLARLLELPVLHAVGVLYGVWRTAYNRRSPYLTEQEIDIGGETPGLAKHMVTAGLAVRVKQSEGSASTEPLGAGSTEPFMLRVNGVESRIEFLVNAAEKGRIGGIRSGEARRKAAEEQQSKRTPSKPSEKTKHSEPSYSYSGSGSERSPLPPKGGSGGTPSRASGSGAGWEPRAPRQTPHADPTRIGNLAAVEESFEAEGHPIPWRDDPRRWAMTVDVLGKPVPKMGPRNGHRGAR